MNQENTYQVHSIDVTLDYNSTNAIQYWEYLSDRPFRETQMV